MDYRIFGHAQVGMTFGELTKFANEQFLKLGLVNNVTSTTNPAGIDIGHTVPASDTGWISSEIEVFNGGNWSEIVDMIRKRRRFLSLQEPMTIQPGVAFTIEQRLTDLWQQGIPMSSYHTIAMFKIDGTKKLLTDFNMPFKLAGMDYMLK